MCERKKNMINEFLKISICFNIFMAKPSISRLIYKLCRNIMNIYTNEQTDKLTNTHERTHTPTESGHMLLPHHFGSRAPHIF